jgi:hypothetical protein
VVVGLEGQAELVVEDRQIALTITGDGLRHDGFNLLRHDAHIGFIAAIVAEAVEADAVVQAAEQDDVVLEPDVGSPSATAASAGAAASARSAARAAARIAPCGGTLVATGVPCGLAVSCSILGLGALLGTGRLFGARLLAASAILDRQAKR